MSHPVAVAVILPLHSLPAMRWPEETFFEALPTTLTTPSFTVNWSAVAPRRAAASLSSSWRAAAAACLNCGPALSMDRLPTVAPCSTDFVVSPEAILMRLTDTSSSSATICASAVTVPVPISTLLVKTVIVPSAPTANQESSACGSRSPLGNRLEGDCAKRLLAVGKRLKLTISAPVPLRNCLRESSIVFISLPPSLYLLSRRALHRAQNPRVGAATAEVSGQRFLDLTIRGLWIGIEQHLGAHDHAVDTIAALHRLLIDKSLLQGVKFLGRSESFESGHRTIGRGLDLSHAGANRAVHDHGASTALSKPAAEFRPVELQLVAQDV